MKKTKIILTILSAGILGFAAYFYKRVIDGVEDDPFKVEEFKGKRYYTYTTSPSSIKMIWKDSNGDIVSTINALKTKEEKNNHKLLFAMNGGMFTPTYEPCGLYVENGKTIHCINTNFEDKGNFCLPFCHEKTNGIFMIKKDKKAEIAKTRDCLIDSDCLYATQSGPILLYDGVINSQFGEISSNVRVRNAVGVNKNGEVVFVKSEMETNFYDIANLFKEKLNCEKALYLDGVISDLYVDGKFEYPLNKKLGVIIYETE